MKFRLAVGLLLFALAAMVVYSVASRSGPAIQAHDSLVASRDSDLAVIREHRDSADAVASRATKRETDAARLAAVAARIRPSRDTGTTGIMLPVTDNPAMRGFVSKLTYDSLAMAYDTLQAAFGILRKANEELRVSSGYWQLAYVADSTRRERAERVAENLRLAIPKTVCETKCKLLWGLGGFAVGALLK